MSDVIDINEKNADKLRDNTIDLDRQNNGSVKTTSVKNVVLILLKDPNLKNLFRLNEFTTEVDAVETAEIKLPEIGKTIIPKGQYTDQVTNSIELYIESQSKYGNANFKNAIIEQAVDNVAYMHSYNPLIDYMNDVYKKWDKKRRLDNFFVDYLGADKNETTTLITRVFFMGAVAKVYNADTKFDYVLDLVGGQGVGKTSILKNIAPLGLYTDQFNTFTKKDDFEVMKNALIVNDDEMTASNDASFEEIKKFITMQDFEYRKPYGHKPVHFKKKFVITRTTNEVRHLKDRSGDRRFLSIYAHPEKQTKNPVSELTPEVVQQLWGEAVWLYKNAKDPFRFTPKQEALLKANREEFRYTSGLEDNLMDVLENKFKDQDFISNRDLSFALFKDYDALSKNSKQTRDIRYYMEHLGFNTSALKKINGKVTRGFEK
ncbi:VapE domain-containing protein [Lactobacillus sp. B4005]|uniref:VapE domain-containing protein n=1 Tax=Lactobacillus sp. B4005 TaxID=2818031 RepID=UPI002269FBBB|nr:VapE domain-containing protein [Lactobacillus sp. B4005]MCX8723077.1 hypothetical protein [Lactobacillus sp. B4005]